MLRLSLLLIAGLVIGCSTAPHTRPPNTPRAATPAAPATTYLGISAADAQIIREYYRSRQAARTRGRGNAGLPPGIAKNLARGKPLPPGIARQVMPAELSARLRPLPNGYQYMVVAGKILLIETATRVIHDVLTDVLFG